MQNIGNLTGGTNRDFIIPPSLAKQQKISSNQYLKQVVRGGTSASPVRSQRADANYLGSKVNHSHASYFYYPQPNALGNSQSSSNILPYSTSEMAEKERQKYNIFSDSQNMRRLALKSSSAKKRSNSDSHSILFKPELPVNQS